MADGIVTLTEQTFDEVVQGSSTPVLVDFWAEWCGPCKMIAPMLGEIAVEHAGKLTIGKLNVDDHPSLAMRYGVQSIPTLLVFKDGKLSKTMVGAKGKGALLQELAEFLSPAH
jgi:thioredoxin 1